MAARPQPILPHFSSSASRSFFASPCLRAIFPVPWIFAEGRAHRVSIIQAVSRKEEKRMAWFRPSPRSAKKQASRSAAGLGVRPRLEELEARVVLTNDFFVVPGTAGTSVQMVFDLNARNSKFLSEVGAYKVDDEAGHVGSLLPSDTGYAQAALGRAQATFSRDTVGGTSQ